MRMIRLLLLPVIWAALTAAAPQPAIPDTPAGRTLQAWLDAFNSGDRTMIGTLVKTISPRDNADNLISLRGQTGGFDLISIDTSEPLHIGLRVKWRNGDTTGIGDLLVKDGNPPSVVSFVMRTLPPGATWVHVVLDANLRKRVLDGIASNLTEYYVDAGVAAKMNEALDAHAKAGDYDSITDGNTFAQKLGSDLRAVSHDLHLYVNFNPFKTLAAQEPSAEDRARLRGQLLANNCAFKRVEILPGNIGYLKFNLFMDADICGATVAAAMGFVAHTDALILDLRDNGGGQPETVSLIASYLFDKPTHLNDVYNRHEDSTIQQWTQPWVPGPRLATQPVFVLTSHRTISGGEGFTFDLKTLKRATIVGETTAGAAHPVAGRQVADYFVIGVPFGTAINPITKTSWEGTGVEPDVKVEADDALATAQMLAAEKIQAVRPAGTSSSATVH